MVVSWFGGAGEGSRLVAAVEQHLDALLDGVEQRGAAAGQADPGLEALERDLEGQVAGLEFGDDTLEIDEDLIDGGFVGSVGGRLRGLPSGMAFGEGWFGHEGAEYTGRRSRVATLAPGWSAR